MAHTTGVSRGLGADGGQGGCLSRGGHRGGWLAEPIGCGSSGLGAVLPPGSGGAVHGLGLDAGHDWVALELTYFLPNISVGHLSIVIRVKCDVPNIEEELHGGLSVHSEDLPGVVQGELARHDPWAVTTREQILEMARFYGAVKQAGCYVTHNDKSQ